MSWEAWIGREARDSDQLIAAHASSWCSTFNLEWPGDGVMPQGIHFTLCTPKARTDCLGIDGHPARDDSTESFMPPIPLPRRMWASSKIEFHLPLKIGDRIERRSTIASVAEKEGSTGKLGFVDVAHETCANGELAVREVQTLVYRDAIASDAPLSPPPPGDGIFDGADWDSLRTSTPDPRLLFRYSALAFNTHRIHYDAPYAEKDERYRGLVVHGPLIASLLLQLAANEVGENALATFEFRAVSPAIADEALTLALRRDGDTVELGSFASDGRQTMKASATLA